MAIVYMIETHLCICCILIAIFSYCMTTLEDPKKLMTNNHNKFVVPNFANQIVGIGDNIVLGLHSTKQTMHVEIFNFMLTLYHSSNLITQRIYNEEGFLPVFISYRKRLLQDIELHAVFNLSHVHRFTGPDANNSLVQSKLNLDRNLNLSKKNTYPIHISLFSFNFQFGVVDSPLFSISRKSHEFSRRIDNKEVQKVQ